MKITLLIISGALIGIICPPIYTRAGLWRFALGMVALVLSGAAYTL